VTLGWQGVYKQYKEFLPSIEEKNIITLFEGNTPLIHMEGFNKAFGLTRINLFVKFEGMNPTGSFKDRGMCVAVSNALQRKAKAIICASTGNTSASAAAYGARVSIPCYVLIPRGKIAHGKLAQALAYGANVMQIEGNFDEALDFVKSLGQKYPMTIVNSINPDRIEGQKTASFEIIDKLGKAPNYHFLPVGNAGNITAYWKGYKEYGQAKKIECLPKMMGFQALGAAPIVYGRKIDNPDTIATAIRIGNPASWKAAVNAARESNGSILAVNDKEILDAYGKLASKEGIFCEPASAASLAGLIKTYKEGQIDEGACVVCTLTGHGLKDPDISITTFKDRISVCKTLYDIENTLLRTFV